MFLAALRPLDRQPVEILPRNCLENIRATEKMCAMRRAPSRQHRFPTPSSQQRGREPRIASSPRPHKSSSVANDLSARRSLASAACVPCGASPSNLDANPQPQPNPTRQLVLRHDSARIKPGGANGASTASWERISSRYPACIHTVTAATRTRFSESRAKKPIQRPTVRTPRCPPTYASSAGWHAPRPVSTKPRSSHAAPTFVHAGCSR